MERGEGISGDFGVGICQKASEGGLASVWEADQPDVGDGFQNEAKVSCGTQASWCCFAWCLVDRCLEIDVTQTAFTACEQDNTFPVHGDLGDDAPGTQVHDLCARRKRQGAVCPVGSVLVASCSWLPVPGVPVRLETVFGEVIFVFIAEQDHVTTLAAIAAVRAALGDEFFPAKTEATVAAIAGSKKNIGLVYEHEEGR